MLHVEYIPMFAYLLFGLISWSGRMSYGFRGGD